MKLKFQFSKTTEDILRRLIDKFQGFIKTRPERLQKSVDKIFKTIFDDINLAHNYVKYLKRNAHVEKKEI